MVVYEDNINPPGQTVSQLFTGGFTDPDDADTLAGIAVINNPQNPAEGEWQYATSAGAWQPIGPASTASALLLDSNTAIRFLPASNYNGTPEPLQLSAIDSAYNGGFTTSVPVVNIGTSVSSAVSLNTEVTAVNDAPLIANAIISPQNEDTESTSPIKILDLFATQYSDIDGTEAIAGIAVTANDATTTQGTWQ